MPKALGDILAVSILIGGCDFLFAKLVCAAILPFCREYIPTLHRGKMAGVIQMSLQIPVEYYFNASPTSNSHVSKHTPWYKVSSVQLQK